LNYIQLKQYGLSIVGAIEPLVFMGAEVWLGVWLSLKMRQERPGLPGPGRGARESLGVGFGNTISGGVAVELSIGATVTLGNGVAMPRFGVGTFRSRPGPETEYAVRTALQLEYRSIDTAAVYGNEAGVGAAIRASGVPREDIFLTSKVWNHDQGYEATLTACDRSLARLGTGYLDLYLVHWPMRRHLEGTWRAMEELLAVGKTRAIGVCNFLPHHLDPLLAVVEIVPAVDQVEFHPRLQQPRLQAYLAEHDIVLRHGRPSWASEWIPELIEIGKSHGKTLAASRYADPAAWLCGDPKSARRTIC
jgi:diketogulonate reductase-like aldo/keto reductase